MPILLVIGACGLALGAAVDKINLARLSGHPPPVDATLPNYMVGTIPYLVCLRLLFSTWVYSTPTVFASSTNDAEASQFSRVDQMVEGFGTFSNRINNATVFHFSLFVVIVLYLLLRAILWPLVEGLYHLLLKTFRVVQCGNPV